MFIVSKRIIMKKVIFDISEELAVQIGSVVRECGFSSRSEFFRYLAIEFIQKRGVPEEAQEEEHIGFGLSPKQLSKLRQEANVIE